METGDYAFCPERGDPTGRTAKKMGPATSERVKRTLIALLLMFVLSFTTVMAETDPQADGSGDAVQTEVSAEPGSGTGETVQTDASAEPDGGTAQDTGVQPETPAVEEPAPAPAPAEKSRIIKKGKYYYYKGADGKIRKKAGFVTDLGKKYYVRKGGKIKTSSSFKVKKKTYRADKYGAVMTGVYKWKGYLYYSDASGVLRTSEGFVTWEDGRYYVKKGGKIVVDEGFSAKNLPYAADKTGRTSALGIPEGNGSPVVEVAKAQVGIMTGKKYWVWYYKTKFRDTDRTPWCGAFVAWVYNKAGLYKKISVAKKFGPLGYVPSYSRYAKKYKKWVKNSEARGGDIIVFGANRHVGLVEGVTDGYIITIEGNAGPTAAIGCKKPGAVVRNAYKINSPQIKGVIRP